MRGGVNWVFAAFVFGILGVAFLATMDQALAMAWPPKPPRGGPGPLVGLGLPAAGVVAVLFLARRFRREN
jgi:hypothetical protein